MDFEFDPVKSEENERTRGLAFKYAPLIFEGPFIEEQDDRFDYGETRFVAIGLIDARLYVMVFTEGSDDDAVRIISLRRAEKHETRYYYGQV